MSQELIFNNKSLSVIEKNNQIWMTSKQLAKALEYKSDKSVTNIFNANSDEFTGSMSMVIESVTNGINNSLRKKSVRIFSLRGAHLIAMFSRTNVAKDFRKWVLDILDRESGVVKINGLITHSQKQELIRTINRCVDRIKEHCNDISIHLCKNFNINQLDELPASKFDDAIEFLSSISKKDVVGMRYLVEVKITDYMFHGEKTIFGKCNDFNSLLTHLALKLGYKIDRLSLSPQTLSF